MDQTFDAPFGQKEKKNAKNNYENWRAPQTVVVIVNK